MAGTSRCGRDFQKNKKQHEGFALDPPWDPGLAGLILRMGGARCNPESRSFQQGVSYKSQTPEFRMAIQRQGTWMGGTRSFLGKDQPAALGRRIGIVFFFFLSRGTNPL